MPIQAASAGAPHNSTLGAQRMRSPSWRTKEIAKICVLVLATFGIFVLAKLWPQYEVALWVGFGSAIVGHVYLELRQPVNYKSIVISKDAVEYTAPGGTDVIRFDEIATLHFVREQALFPISMDLILSRSGWCICPAASTGSTLKSWMNGHTGASCCGRSRNIYPHLTQRQPSRDSGRRRKGNGSATRCSPMATTVVSGAPNSAMDCDTKLPRCGD